MNHKNTENHPSSNPLTWLCNLSWDKLTFLRTLPLCPSTTLAQTEKETNKFLYRVDFDETFCEHFCYAGVIPAVPHHTHAFDICDISKLSPLLFIISLHARAGRVCWSFADLKFSIGTPTQSTIFAQILRRSQKKISPKVIKN